MDGFTKLEEAALRAYATLSGEPALFLRWIGSAKVTERENTGHGFYTSFDAVFPQPQWRVSEDFKSKPISGPIFEMEGFEPDTLISFLLWDGTLEGYQLGTDVDLKKFDLADLEGVWRESWTSPDSDNVRTTELREGESDRAP